MMDVLPNVPVILLAIVAVWFVWPLIADPITGRRDSDRADGRTVRRDSADDLFDLWADRRQF